MAIVEEDIAKVRAATDFVAVASEHIALKKVGRRWTGLCPFHAEKSPSFSVNAEEGLYYCFGCQAKGDVITFVREIEHVDFVEAVEKLASRANIALRYDEADAGKDRSQKKKLTEALDQAVEWYHQRLLNGADAASARGYLRSRGYDGDVVREFKLGWAPDEWDALAQGLKLPTEILENTGLGFVNRRQRQQDAFRGRIMFPIFDATGKPVAFGGRIMPGAEGPKYKNSPETPVYAKRRTLYGLNWAKANIVDTDEVVVCEGYTDVIGFFRSDVPRAVATCGTALADDHFRLLKNFTRRVVLAYDADAAGQAAAERFYAWEKQYEIDIAVAAIPKGKDPGELAQEDPAALRTAIEGARPFLAFRIDRVLLGANLSTPEGRARAAEVAIGVIAEHPSELVRDQYMMEVADKCRIEPDRLRELVSNPNRARPTATSSTRRTTIDYPLPEVEMLRMAVHLPELLTKQLTNLDAASALITDEVVLGAFMALANANTLHDALEHLAPEEAQLLQRLVVEEPPDEDNDAVIRVVDRAATRALHELSADAGRSTGDLAEFSITTSWLQTTLERLRNSAEQADALAALVSWLMERNEANAA